MDEVERKRNRFGDDLALAAIHTLLITARLLSPTDLTWLISTGLPFLWRKRNQVAGWAAAIRAGRSTSSPLGAGYWLG